MKQTVLVTGGSGYIGSWVVKGLVEKGYTVRVAVRNKSNTEKYQHLIDLGHQNTGNVELWEADLLTQHAFDDIAEGADSIIHLASPFTLNLDNPQVNLIDPALKGTQNVLNAATKSSTVKKIVLTSSIAAIFGDNIDLVTQNISELNENNFNTTSSITHQPYSYSKLLAEKEAWKIHSNQTQWNLVVINPGFVMGPGLTKNSNSGSIDFMKDILKGKFKMGAPLLYFSFVDVRDIAAAHIKALENEKAQGRYIVTSEVLDLRSFTKLIEESFPKQFKLPTMTSPKWLMMLVGPLFGVTREFVKNNVGYPLKISNAKSKAELKMNYTPIKQSVIDMIKWLKP